MAPAQLLGAGLLCCRLHGEAGGVGVLQQPGQDGHVLAVLRWDVLGDGREPGAFQVFEEVQDWVCTVQPPG